MRLDPGQTKSGMLENKETTAIKDKDEKIINAKSEGTTGHSKSKGTLTLAKTPKTSPQSTTNTPKLKEDKVENTTTGEFQDEPLSVSEIPVTVYYVSKLSSV